MHITHTFALLAGLSLAGTALAKGSYTWADQGIFAHTNQDGPEGRSLNHVPPNEAWLAIPTDNDKKAMKLLADPLFTPKLFPAPHINVASVLSLIGVGDTTADPPAIDQSHALLTLALGLDTSPSQTTYTPVQLPTTVPVPGTIALLGLGAIFARRRRRQAY